MGWSVALCATMTESSSCHRNSGLQLSGPWQKDFASLLPRTIPGKYRDSINYNFTFFLLVVSSSVFSHFFKKVSSGMTFSGNPSTAPPHFWSIAKALSRGTGQNMLKEVSSWPPHPDMYHVLTWIECCACYRNRIFSYPSVNTGMLYRLQHIPI